MAWMPTPMTSNTRPPGDGPELAPGSAQAPRQDATAPRLLLVDADDALAALLGEWLADEGCVVQRQAGECPAPGEGERFDAVLVDVPFPRQGGADLLRRVAQAHPGTPILALSSTFFSGIECCGPVARELGVTCVLAKPASRAALSGAVRRLFSS
jgi:CheY-like chemotaxis protein